MLQAGLCRGKAAATAAATASTTLPCAATRWATKPCRQKFESTRHTVYISISEFTVVADADYLRDVSAKCPAVFGVSSTV